MDEFESEILRFHWSNTLITERTQQSHEVLAVDYETKYTVAYSFTSFL
jgi:hypothetical protein